MAITRLATLCLCAVLGQAASAFYPGNAYYQNNPLSLTIPMQGSGYNQFSTCFYINLKSPIPVTQQIPILAYLASDAQTAEIVFELEYERQVSGLFIGGGNGAYFPIVPPTNQWTHICLTWNGYLGLVKAYADGVPIGMANGIQTGYHIPGQGMWNVGQPQLDVGQISQLHFWDRVISDAEVKKSLDCSLSGNVLSWNSSAMEYLSDPCTSDLESCPGHSTASPLDRDDLDVGGDTYIVNGLFDKKLPKQNYVSFCAWLYSEEGTKLHPLAVNDKEGLEMFGIFVLDDGSLGLLVGGAENPKERIFPNLKIEYYKWDHYCVTWSGRDGKSQVFVNGHLKHVMRDVMIGYSLPAGNKLWVKQLQYDNADVVDPTKGFAFKITDVNWWDHVVTKDEVSQVYSCSGSLPGNILSSNKDKLEFYDAWQEELSHEGTQQEVAPGGPQDQVEVSTGGPHDQEEVCQERPTTSPLDSDNLDVGTVTYKVEGVFNKKLPQQNQVSFCAWLYIEGEDAEIDPLGVYGLGDPGMIRIFVHGNGSLGLQMRATMTREELIIPDLLIEPRKWDHYCVTWSADDGKTQVFVNGDLKSTSTDFMTSYNLPAGNKLWVRQLQYDNVDVNDPTKGFALKIVDVNWWDRVITKDEVAQVYSCSGSLPGNLFSWNNDTLQNYGTCRLPETTSFMDSLNPSEIPSEGDCSARAYQKEANPRMNNFSICAWTFISGDAGRNKETLFIADKEDKDGSRFDFIMTKRGLRFELNDLWDIDFDRQPNSWYHTCLTFESSTGLLQFYLNGKFLSKKTNFQAGAAVAKSKFMWYQIQTQPYDQTEPTKGMRVKATALNLWNYVITEDTVHDVFCGKAAGNVINKDTEFENLACST